MPASSKSESTRKRKRAASQPLKRNQSSQSQLFGDVSALPWLSQFVYPTLRPDRRLMVELPRSKRGAGNAPRNRRTSIHLEQGALDGACGQHCLLMALTLLGHRPANGWHDMTNRTGAIYRPFTDALKERFFVGTALIDLVELMKLFPASLDCATHKSNNGGTKRLVQFCIDQLAIGAVVILGVAPTPRTYGHWTLVVGCEVQHRVRPTTKRDRSQSSVNAYEDITALLCIDPAEGDPSIATHNARLDLTTPSRHGRGKRAYISASGTQTGVALIDALALRPRPSPSKRGRVTRLKKEQPK